MGEQIPKRPSIKIEFFLALGEAIPKVDEAQRHFPETVMFSIAGGLDLKGIPITKENLKKGFGLIDPTGRQAFEDYRGKAGGISFSVESEDNDFADDLLFGSLSKSRAGEQRSIKEERRLEIQREAAQFVLFKQAVVAGLRSEVSDSPADLNDDQILDLASERFANAIIARGQAAGFKEGHPFWEDLGHVKHGEQMRDAGVSDVLDKMKGSEPEPV